MPPFHYPRPALCACISHCKIIVISHIRTGKFLTGEREIPVKNLPVPPILLSKTYLRY